MKSTPHRAIANRFTSIIVAAIACVRQSISCAAVEQVDKLLAYQSVSSKEKRRGDRLTAVVGDEPLGDAAFTESALTTMLA